MSESTNKYHNNGAPHTGQMLERIIKDWRVCEAALARKLGRHRSTFEDFCRRESMQTGVLWEISQVMNYNFFSDIAEQLPPTFRHKQTAAEKEIAELKAEIEALKQENITLQRVADMLTGNPTKK